MSTPARFSDGQYKNWIKCSHSLIIMKEALHDYIDNEVNKLHGDIKLKVSSILCSTPTVTQCGYCSWKNIKLTGGKHGKWNINCKNSICNKWLHYILAVHDDPQNPTINWRNADISKWAIDGYQVAKIFMPKGQDKTTNMPEELDSPAILSLMKYCNWFRKDLPNTQILSDLIDIRNKVLHSGDLKVADADKNSWIDLMIQLLSDLNIHGDIKTEVHMLKREDIDINFRETEIRVLQNLVSCLENDLTSVKDDMECVQKLQSQLSEEVEHLRDNSTKTTINVDTLDTDIQRMKASLDELKTISDKMMSFFEKNADIYEIKITETIQNIARDVQEQQGNMSKLETELLNIKVRLSKLEEEVKLIWTNQKETDKEIKELKKRFEEPENDEQLSLQKENPRKKRPETDGLKQLKHQTEDKLDTLARLQYIPTEQAEIAKTLLQRNRSVVIKGNPGEGKTTTALHLIDNEIYRDKRVVLYYPKEWKKVDTNWVDIVVIEDIFGQFDLDPARLQEWIVYLSTIQEHIDAGKISVIVTTRVDILLKAYSSVGSVKLFSDDFSLLMSSKQLTNSEKTRIFNRELHRHNKNMVEDDKKECITNFGGLIGFPQCCALFAADNKSFERGTEFFRSPEKFFVANITELENTRFLCLAFLFCNGKIWEEHLSPETMPETGKHLLMELASHLHIAEKEASITLLRHAYDSFLDLYVVKSISYDFILESYVQKSCIKFTHATVCEAVGQILGDRCVEMIVKYGKSEYLYQRTYTAPTKDGTSQNVFIPLSVYRPLAKRMVNDVVHINRGLVSIVKYSALRQYNFLKELKCELLKDNSNKSFFMPVPHLSIPLYDDNDGDDDDDDDDGSGGGSDYDSVFDLSERKCKNSDSSKEKCDTFMQYILQGDETVVRLVYSELLEFLACVHSEESSNCFQCREKQKLLELALYYHHFQIADKLIAMNACYTHVCLCNTVRHGDFERVQTILETLKKRQVFNPGCKEAKDALFRAYISENKNLIELLLNEHIILDSNHVVDAVQYGNMKTLMEVVEHLKFHKKWKPHWEKPSRYIYWNYVSSYWHFSDVKKQTPCYTALVLACFHDTFDMVDYLLKNEVQGSLCMLRGVSKWSSEQVVARMLRTLKDSNIWDPMCDEATTALANAYRDKKFDVCDLLVQNGVSLTMKNLPDMAVSVSFDYITKIIQNMKDTEKWDPKCDYASNALQRAYTYQLHDVCGLLIQEGISLTMKNIYYMVNIVSFDYIKKAIQNMKDTDNWDPLCDEATTALVNAYRDEKFDVCDLLVQNGVSLTMKNLPDMAVSVSFDYITKIIQNMKDTDNWDPKCDDASKALETAYIYQQYDMFNLLVEEGLSLTMKHLPDMVDRVPFEYIKKAIQNMKVANNWNPNCDDASKTLKLAYYFLKYDVFDLLVEEGVSLTMENLSNMVHRLSFEAVKKAIQNMKETDTWDPKCDDASYTLAITCGEIKYDVCDLLYEEGVSVAIKYLPNMVYRVSFDYIKKAIQNMKDTNIWDPKSEDAHKALENAYSCKYYDVCDLLVKEGVSLTMKTLPYMVCSTSIEYIKNAIQNMKATDNWDPKSDDAYEALKKCYTDQKYNVCDLLVKEGVSLTMKDVRYFLLSVSFESVKKAIQTMKDTDYWDPKCYDSSEALEYACRDEKYDVCDLLVKEGVPLTMKNLHIMVQNVSSEYLMKTIQNMKDTGYWNPKSYYASNALAKAYSYKKYNVCDLLVQEGVSLNMKHLPDIVYSVVFERIKKAIKNIKDTNIWDAKCDDALKALKNAYNSHRFDVCDLLVKEGVSLTMKNLPAMVGSVPLKTVKKIMQHLKETDNWYPKCADASKALEIAFRHHKSGVFHLLYHEGVSLTMKILSDMVDIVSSGKSVQNIKDTDNGDSECDDASKVLERTQRYQHYTICDQGGDSLTIKTIPDMADNVWFENAIQNMKDTDNWDPECDDASKALEIAYIYRKYDLCDLLVQNGVSLTMKNLPDIAVSVSYEYIKKIIKNMKDTKIWDAKCNDALKSLEKAYNYHKYDVCDLLVKEGVSLTMKNLPDLVRSEPLKTVKKLLQHLKETENWDLKCDDASKALESGYRHQKLDVCDLLVEEGVSLTMKTLLHMACSVPFQCIKKAIQTMKDTDNLDLNCADASEELAKIYTLQKYDVCDLLIHEGISITMKNLLDVVYSARLESVQKALQHLNYTDKWDPKCDDAAEAFVIAFECKKYDVCDLLVEEGVELTMKNLSAITGASDVSYKVYDSYFKLEDEDSLSVENLSSVKDGVSLEYIKKTIQNVKDNGNWYPKCVDAYKAFENAYELKRYDVCDLLVQEGVSLTMNNLPFGVLSVSFANIRKAIQNMKDSEKWDPKCDDASEALDNAYRYQKYDVCDLLVQEEVSLTMKTLPAVIGVVSLSVKNRSNMVDSVSFEYITKTIHHLKDANNWDPKSDHALEALQYAYSYHKYDVCDLLVKEGVSLAINTLPDIFCSISTESVKKAVQTMKENENWYPKCVDVSKAFKCACMHHMYDVCDLLFQEGVSLTMNILPDMVSSVSSEYIRKTIQYMKETDNWDPKCDDASKALEMAFCLHKNDVCDLLDQEGVSLTMNNLPRVVESLSFKNISLMIQTMKDNDKWDPKCDHACEALKDAFMDYQYDVFDLLVQEGVSLTMEWLSNVVHRVPLKTFTKLVQNVNDTEDWDPKSDDASKLLENALRLDRRDICDLLFQEGVSLTMKNLTDLLEDLVNRVSFEYISKAVHNMKDTQNWDPKCDDAYIALENACHQRRYDVCFLLLQEGVLLTMENLLDVVDSGSFEYIRKAVQNMKDTHNWDPKCDNASIAFENAYRQQMYDVCDLLVQEGVLPSSRTK